MKIKVDDLRKTYTLTLLGCKYKYHKDSLKPCIFDLQKALEARIECSMEVLDLGYINTENGRVVSVEGLESGRKVIKRILKDLGI